MNKDTPAAVQVFDRLAKQIVNHTDDLKVSWRQFDNLLIVEVNTNPKDYGKLVGQQGKIANAFSLILKLIGRRSDVVVRFVMVKPKEFISTYKRFSSSITWDSRPIVKLLSYVAINIFAGPVQVRADDMEDTTILYLDADAKEFETQFAVTDGKVSQLGSINKEELSGALATVFLAICKAKGRGEVFMVINGKHEAQPIQHSVPNRR